MDVAFFTETYLPTRDGVAVEVSSLARELQRLGHSVRVYTANPVQGAPTEEVEINGIPVVRSRSLPVPLYREYRWALSPFLQLRGRHFRSEVDVVHIHTPGVMGGTGFLAARHYGKPLVGTFHTNVWEMRHSFPSKFLVQLFFRIAWWYNLGTYLRCDLTTAPTTEARDALVRDSRKPFRRPIEVVPNGIEVDRFHPGISTPDWRERCGLPSEPLVTYLGRLTTDKGIHRFLDAVREAASVEPFVSIVAGAGPEASAVRARLKEDGILQRRVRYIGPVAEEEKPGLLAQSDLFVLPSTSDTSSIALLEAMACGAACVVSSSGGAKDLVLDGVTGRLVSVGVPGSVSSAIVDLLQHPADRKRLGSEAVRYVRSTASIEATARRFISLYELLLTELPRGVGRQVR